MNIRTQLLDLCKDIKIDEYTHSNLRLLKRRLKKSMAQIIKDLVEEKINLINN